MDESKGSTNLTKSISQLAAILSVILSLLFVGYEIRQNTAVARSEAHNEFGSRTTELLAAVATDQRLSLLVSQIGEGKLPKDFSPADRISIRYLLTAAVRNAEARYRSVKEGILPESTLVDGGSIPLADNNFFRSTWPNAKLKYPADFVEHLERGVWNK